YVSYSYRLTTLVCSISFFLHYTPTTYIYTLSLHDALPILFVIVRFCFIKSILCGAPASPTSRSRFPINRRRSKSESVMSVTPARSEEHTSELQSRVDLVCRLLLEKKKKKRTIKPQRTGNKM